MRKPKQQPAPPEQPSVPFTTVDVMGKQYVVQWPVHIYEEDGEQAGDCSARNQLVRIGTDHHIDQQRDTVLHEFMHAVDEELNLELEEHQIQRLATGLLQVLRSNPALAEFILG